MCVTAPTAAKDVVIVMMQASPLVSLRAPSRSAAFGVLDTSRTRSPGKGIAVGGHQAVAVGEQRTKEQVMSLGTILLIVIILILLGVLPTWPHARSWGYGPSGIVGVVLIIVLVLFLMGRL
jgi:hypothetical protein